MLQHAYTLRVDGVQVPGGRTGGGGGGGMDVALLGEQVVELDGRGVEVEGLELDVGRGGAQEAVGFGQVGGEVLGAGVPDDACFALALHEEPGEVDAGFEAVAEDDYVAGVRDDTLRQLELRRARVRGFVGPPVVWPAGYHGGCQIMQWPMWREARVSGWGEHGYRLHGCCMRACCMRAYCIRACCMRAYCMRACCMRACCLRACCLRACCLRTCCLRSCCLRACCLRAGCLRACRWCALFSIKLALALPAARKLALLEARAGSVYFPVVDASVALPKQHFHVRREPLDVVQTASGI